jgi:hypothetical protein
MGKLAGNNKSVRIAGLVCLTSAVVVTLIYILGCFITERAWLQIAFGQTADYIMRAHLFGGAGGWKAAAGVGILLSVICTAATGVLAIITLIRPVAIKLLRIAAFGMFVAVVLGAMCVYALMSTVDYGEYLVFFAALAAAIASLVVSPHNKQEEKDNG